MISAGIIVDISLLFYRFQWTRLVSFYLVALRLQSLSHIDVQASAYSSFKHTIEMSHYKIECIIDVIHSQARRARVNVYSQKYIYSVLLCRHINGKGVWVNVRAMHSKVPHFNFSFSLFEHSNPMHIIHLYYYNYIQ